MAATSSNEYTGKDTRKVIRVSELEPSQDGKVDVCFPTWNFALSKEQLESREFPEPESPYGKIWRQEVENIRQPVMNGDKIDNLEGLVVLSPDEMYEYVKKPDEFIQAQTFNYSTGNLQLPPAGDVTTTLELGKSPLFLNEGRVQEKRYFMSVLFDKIVPPSLRANMVVCGGAVNRAVCVEGRWWDFSDFDLFVFGKSSETMTKLCQRYLDAVLTICDAKDAFMMRTGNAVTFKFKVPIPVGLRPNAALWKCTRESITITTQLILRHYDTLSEVLHGFDVDCCGVAFYANKYYATQRARLALATRTNTVNVQLLSPTYEKRLSKYKVRGFNIHVPGTTIGDVRYVQEVPLTYPTGMLCLVTAGWCSMLSDSHQAEYDDYESAIRITGRYIDSEDRVMALMLDDRGIYGLISRDYTLLGNCPVELSNLEHTSNLIQEFTLVSKPINATQFTGSFHPISMTWGEWLDSGLVVRPQANSPQLAMVKDDDWDQWVKVENGQVVSDKGVIRTTNGSLVVVECRPVKTSKKYFCLALTEGQHFTREMTKGNMWKWDRTAME